MFILVPKLLVVFDRVAKEKTMYEKEAQMLKDRVEKMKSEGKDGHEIKKQVRVVIKR